jgi:DNA invertase Pin-like site-specific DNA recombinase
MRGEPLKSQEKCRPGKRPGRPPGGAFCASTGPLQRQLGRPPIALEVEERIRDALRARKHTGEGVRGIAKRFGVGPGTVQRISTSPFDGSAALGQL